MFKKILIANRGEIALRVIRACRELGIETVAVYSTADGDACTSRFADEAVCIGPPPSKRELPQHPRHHLGRRDHRRRRRSIPATASWPRTPTSPRCCETASIGFIGPRPEMIRLMGDKVAAREAAKEAGVPLLPGSRGRARRRPPRRWRLRREIGYPVILKAAAGGGGRGMRIVRETRRGSPQPSRTARPRRRPRSATATCTSRSTWSSPRHIEIQVFGDEHGNVVHLGERECSIQRRHQKLIEESPVAGARRRAPRARWARSASRRCSEIGYENAGTIEFLLDERRPASTSWR